MKAAISSDNRDFALKSVDKVQQDIAARNKTVKHGWVTVREYEGNLITDNSDDERRLRQAEIRAIRKTKANSALTTSRYNNGPRFSISYFRARKGASS